ncbi:hypothetical protein JXO52_09095 [bacterium]|nr:hypothetical protein [bacterium]
MITQLCSRRTGDDPEADILHRKLLHEGYTSLTQVRIERVFRLEGIGPAEALKLAPLLCNPSAESLSESSELTPADGPVFEVGYQRAVTDPELPSVLRGATALRVSGLEWVRIAHRYQFTGLDEKSAASVVHRYLYNPQVQVLITPDDAWDTLKPRGEAGPVETIPLRNLDDAALAALSEGKRLFLNGDQMRALREISVSIGRDLTDAEVEMFAQTWSDHCFHTTWKSLGLLRALWDATTAIDHPLVLSVFEDNAGAMEFYDGWALTLKGETHNSPTAVSPYGGIMTKHGGVIRDTLGCGQGAKPIGGSTVMGVGDPFMDWNDLPRGVLHPKTILSESIRGTADYTNPMGIPMMFPVYKFHRGYTGKCFALGHSIGFIPADRSAKGKPRTGDLALLIGGLTGMDGLHGATVSSSSMTSETHVVDAAHVQIGHPIEERKFMEAIPILRDADCLRAITDLGAAGLSSAAGEMGAETGIWINLARVPLKTEGMHAWEIWISESQERMLLCVPPEKLKQTRSILDDYEVPGAVIGTFTDSGRCQVIFDPAETGDPLSWPKRPPLSGETAVDLDFHTLRKGCPLPVFSPDSPGPAPRVIPPPPLTGAGRIGETITRVLSDLNICDQSPAGTQFDTTVQGITVEPPFSGISGRMPNDVWISAPIRGKPFGAAASMAFTPRYGDVDPAGMAKLMIIESITRLVCAGVSRTEITLCDNFYTPRVNSRMARLLTDMVDACCSLSRTFGTPFISGKDSSSGTFIGEDGTRLDIPPTLAVMALGRMPDVTQRVTKPFKKAGNALLLAGPLTARLGGSIYADLIASDCGPLPDPDPEEMIVFWELLADAREQGLIKSASPLSEGGLIRRAFEMALGSGLGCSLDLSTLQRKLGGGDPAPALFGEMIGAVLLEVDPLDGDALAASLPAVIAGEVTGSPELRITTVKETLSMTMDELARAWERPFREAAQ